ncbi:23432_t:CDS:2 [Gigaspora rosea]|nr:23432_t:CDS:2 [Gigaspora rosea]
MNTTAAIQIYIDLSTIHLSVDDIPTYPYFQSTHSSKKLKEDSRRIRRRESYRKSGLTDYLNITE